jgi:hypothetical protein
MRVAGINTSTDMDAALPVESLICIALFVCCVNAFQSFQRQQAEQFQQWMRTRRARNAQRQAQRHAQRQATIANITRIEREACEYLRMVYLRRRRNRQALNARQLTVRRYVWLLLIICNILYPHEFCINAIKCLVCMIYLEMMRQLSILHP